MAIECYRFTIQGISTGEQCQNVLHFLCDNNDDTPPIECASGLVDYWSGSILDDWLEGQSNRYGVRWIEAQRVLPGGGNAWWKEYPEGVQVGGLNEEQGVLQLAPIMKLYCGLSNGVQGRCFLPAPPDSAVVANVVQSAYQTAMLDAFTKMLSFNDGYHDWDLAVYSKKLNQGFQVTTTALSNILGSIGNRRKPM